MSLIEDQDERLIELLHAGPLGEWAREDIGKSRIMRFAQAYLMLAECKYRPAAPSDGFGHIQLTAKQLGDKDRLYAEAVSYAIRFAHEDDKRDFRMGCSNYTTNRAFVLAIEAARLLCSGDGDVYAKRLLRAAIEEINREIIR
jgi:hypothetical protein